MKKWNCFLPATCNNKEKSTDQVQLLPTTSNFQLYYSLLPQFFLSFMATILSPGEVVTIVMVANNQTEQSCTREQHRGICFGSDIGPGIEMVSQRIVGRQATIALTEPRGVLQHTPCNAVQERGVHNNSCLKFHMQSQQSLLLRLTT